MPNENTIWRDLCDKKQLNFGFTPPPCSLKTYSFLYLLYISVIVPKKIGFGKSYFSVGFCHAQKIGAKPDFSITDKLSLSIISNQYCDRETL